MTKSEPSDLETRFIAMRSCAPAAFWIASISTVATHYLQCPPAIFALGSCIAGLLVYLAWASALKGNTNGTAVAAVASILALLGSAVDAIESDLALLFATGFSHIAVVLFGILYFGRRSPSK